jgi:O-antigen/teichoic acid export membrane protein
MARTLRRRAQGWHWRLNFAVVRDWLKEASSLGFGDLVRNLTWQLDTLLLALMQPLWVVGIYSVAYKPLGPLNWLPKMVSQACFPSFARMATGDREALGKAFSTSTRVLWVISVPIAVAICVLAEPLIIFLAGADYLAAAAPMRILIWIATLSFLSVQFRFIFTATGRQGVFAVLMTIVFLIELVVELALIPHWSYFGAATGSLVGELFCTVVGLTICWRLGLGRFEWRAALGATLAGAGMAAALWPARGLPLPLLVPAAALSGVLYLGLCLLFGAVSRAEVWHFVEAVRHPQPRRRGGAATPVAEADPGTPVAPTVTAVGADLQAVSGSVS